MMTNQIQDTVDQNMKSAISMLFPIAAMNQDSQLKQTFFDVDNGSAIVGFRRQVANLGVLLVRAQYGRNNEVEIGPNNNMRINGNYNYITNEYVESNEGLLGTEQKIDYRERVNDEVARQKIDAVRKKTEAMFEVDLSPNTLYQFMESRYRDYGKMYRDRKINFMFTEGLPKGTMLAMAEVDNGEFKMIYERGNKIIKFQVDKKSNLQPRNIVPGKVYLIKKGSIDPETGVKYVNVVRPYKTGVRCAIQHINMGLIKPGEKAYEVTPDATNGIIERTVMDMRFLPHQNPKLVQGAPMLVFDLDIVYSLMKALSGYPSVKMKFRDASSGVYLFAEGDEYRPVVEAIIGPTIQYVKGKVCLP